MLVPALAEATSERAVELLVGQVTALETQADIAVETLGVVDLRGQITTILDPKVLFDIDVEGSEELIVVSTPTASRTRAPSAGSSTTSIR